jgi:hypothetical protein
LADSKPTQHSSEPDNLRSFPHGESRIRLQFRVSRRRPENQQQGHDKWSPNLWIARPRLKENPEHFFVNVFVGPTLALATISIFDRYHTADDNCVALVKVPDHYVGPINGARQNWRIVVGASPLLLRKECYLALYSGQLRHFASIKNVDRTMPKVSDFLFCPQV